MKLLFDVNHPAHVHYFKGCLRLLRERGHATVVTARDRPPALELLDACGERYVSRGPGGRGLLGKLLALPLAELRLLAVARRERPDVFVSFGTPYPNHVAWLLRRPAVDFHDTESARLALALCLPFAAVVCTPACYRRDLGPKQVRFPGTMELAYLHPRRFTPDPSVRHELGLGPGERYVVVRFVDWQATHDVGHAGLGPSGKREAVRRLSALARVLVSSETALPSDLAPFALRIRPERIHHVLAGAALLYGESATMASEAAVLGTPAIYVDDEGRGYTDEEESRYGLLSSFPESSEGVERSLRKAEELLLTPGLREEWQRRRGRLLAESIDVTAFMAWLLDGFPATLRVLRDDPSYPDRFR